jgi:hypothetical protein
MKGICWHNNKIDRSKSVRMLSVGLPLQVMFFGFSQHGLFLVGKVSEPQELNRTGLVIVVRRITWRLTPAILASILILTAIAHPAIQVRDRLSLENALGDLVVQDRPNWQRRKGPRAEVLASCSRGAEEPAFLPRDRRYFRKDRDVYRRQIDG